MTIQRIVGWFGLCRLIKTSITVAFVAVALGCDTGDCPKGQNNCGKGADGKSVCCPFEEGCKWETQGPNRVATGCEACTHGKCQGRGGPTCKHSLEEDCCVGVAFDDITTNCCDTGNASDPVWTCTKPQVCNFAAARDKNVPACVNRD